MINYNQFLLNRIIPHQMFHQLCNLLEGIMVKSQCDKIFLTEEDLLSQKKLIVNQFEFVSFRLIIANNLQSLLLVEKEIDNLYYQISIAFSSEIITNFYGEINPYLNPQIKRKLEAILSEQKSDSLSSLSGITLQEELMFNVLNIMTQPLKSFNSFNHYQSIQSILNKNVKQEKIFQKVTKQIEENLDLLVIVKMTIEQVQNLLQIDRLVIYQLNVLTSLNDHLDDENKLQNMITFEAKSSEMIPSILNFSEEVCFTNIEESMKKYREGFTLVIDDVTNSDVDSCLKDLMQQIGVKSKVVIPIIVKDKLWGLLIAHQCFSTRTWKANEVKFLQRISEYLAVAIYKSNSYQQLQQQKELLEKQIETRAKQLQDALLAAQIANKSKSEFLGNISHELRTPLTCVIGLSNTLLYWSKNNQNLSLDKQKRYLEIIQKSGKHLLELINQTLDFADLEAGKSLLKISSISLQELSRKIWLYSLPIAKSKGIKLTLDFQGKNEDDLLFADEERLTQIIFNLIDNGIKFTPSGGEVIFRIWQENNQAIFQIEDNGIGIYKNQLENLFNQFQKLESYRTRTNSGTGLGLALTKHLVELHGGRIEVESLVGKGSSFTVFIPNSHKVKLPKIVKKKKTLKPQNKTIILISKDEEIATFICELLTAAEYQVIWLFDISDVIDKIQVFQPKLVILQQELNEIYQIINDIKYDEDKDKIKFLIIRKEMNDNDWQQLSSKGINDYLLQPLQPRLLLNKISHILNNK